MPSRDTAKGESRSSQESKDVASSAGEQKRKYRRHPKPDENAPEKQPSAYVIFSNRIREEVRGDNLSFTEIARLVGERWQKLDPAQKDLYESHAATLKDKYNAQLAEYKKTETYRLYMEYLADFRAKQSGISTSETKRPRLDTNNSSSLSGLSHADSEERMPTPSGHARGGSISSVSTTSYAGQPGVPLAPVLQLMTSVPNLGALEAQRSPSTFSSSQERLQTSQAPGQFLMINDNTDSSDALSYASQLSFDPSTVGISSPSGTTPRRLARQDYQSIGAQPTHRSNRQAPLNTYNQLSSSSIGASPASIISPYSSASQDRRDRSSEAMRQHYTASTAQSPQQPGSLPISQLLAPQASASATSQRTLPPLPNVSSMPTNTSVPFPAIGASAASGHAHQLQPGSEIMAFRRARPRAAPNRTDSEAADSLAALAQRQHSESSLRPPRGEPRR